MRGSTKDRGSGDERWGGETAAATNLKVAKSKKTAFE
jgi:hypothetical protein